jgi:prevent-host-death family protein
MPLAISGTGGPARAECGDRKIYRLAVKRVRVILSTIFCTISIEVVMGISASDVVPLSAARANLSELAEAVNAGAEKIITKNGESYIALIDTRRLDYYHQLEREHIHLLLIDEAAKGLEDVAAGRVTDARSALENIKRRRAT